MTEQEELMVALASVKCPKCKGVGKYDSGDPAVRYLGASDDCESCSGSGFLLQGVREKCPCCPEGVVCDYCYAVRSKDHTQHSQDCLKCQGRGWEPSDNLWEWFEAAEQYFLALPFIPREPWYTWEDIKNHISDGKLEFFRSLAAALGIKE